MEAGGAHEFCYVLNKNSSYRTQRTDAWISPGSGNRRDLLGTLGVEEDAWGRGGGMDSWNMKNQVVRVGGMKEGKSNENHVLMGGAFRS